MYCGVNRLQTPGYRFGPLTSVVQVSPPGPWVLDLGIHGTSPPIEWTSSPPVITAVIIAPKGAESPGSGRFFLSFLSGEDPT